MPGNNKVKTAKQLQGEYLCALTVSIKPSDKYRADVSPLFTGKKGNGKKDLHPESRRVKQAARVELRTKRVTGVSRARSSAL